MQLTLTPDDIASSVTDSALADEIRNQPVVLGGENDRLKSVYDALPQALSKKLRHILPTDFVVHEIEMQVSFSANPLGIGIAGNAIVRFGPAKSVL